MNKKNKTDIMHWVSVKDGLPKENQCVIIFDGEGVKDFYYYNNLGEFRDFSTQSKNNEVTHWMPLPKPPCNNSLNED